MSRRLNFLLSRLRHAAACDRRCRWRGAGNNLKPAASHHPSDHAHLAPVRSRPSGRRHSIPCFD